MRIRFAAVGVEIHGTLDDSPTSRALQERLPLTVRMTRWGDEYYGSIGDELGVDQAPEAREVMDLGELAYWPVGNALCLFFGPTPVSNGDEPRAASPVNPVGRLEGTLDRLKELPAAIEAQVTPA